MADDFAERYAGLLTGSYDCVDWVVLNAYFPLGHNPGGFRCWWRPLHGGSDDQLDDAHLMRMAGRFARRVKAWAAANGVPVIFCKAGERKHLIAGEYLQTHVVTAGVFLVLAAKAPATVWKVHRSARGVITRLEKKREHVYHYSFHIMDPAFGHLAVKMMTVGTGTLLLCRGLIGPGAAVGADWALWLSGTALGLVTACWILYLMMTKRDR